MPVMMALISDKELIDFPDVEKLTFPTEYNHPIHSLTADEVTNIDNAKKFDAAVPVLLDTYDRHYSEFFCHPSTGRQVYTDLRVDSASIMNDIVDDIVAAKPDITETIMDVMRNKDGDDDTYYRALRRGRSWYQHDGSDLDCDRPIASHAHRRGRRALSLPPVYDATLQYFDLDPLEGTIADSAKHKTELIKSFRNTSNQHLLHPGPGDKKLKGLGVGEDCATSKDIFRSLYSFTKQHQLSMTAEHLTMFRDYLRHSEKYDVTCEELRLILFPPQVLVSAGMLYYSDEAADKEQERQDALAVNPKPAKLDTLRANWKDLQNDNKARARGTYRSTIHKEVSRPKQRQNTDTNVFLTVHDDPFVKQYARVRIKKNYINRTKAGQPAHVALINFNERNSRCELYTPSRTEPQPAYSPEAVGLHNVSAEGCQTYLEHLFPHVLKSNPEYFTKLRVTLVDEQALWILTLPYNNAHWTSNLFSCNPNQPPLLRAFASAVSHRPRAFFLFRTTEAMAQIFRQQIVKPFMDETYTNPLPLALLNEPEKLDTPFSAKALKPMADLALWHAKAYEQSFQDWADYKLRMAAGVTCEALYAQSSAHSLYTGKAVLVPVAKTYKMEEKLFMVYACTSKSDQKCRKSPALQQGDKLKMWINSNTPEVGQCWKATVATRFSWASLDDVCFWVSRPVAKGVIDDKEPLNRITAEALDQCTEQQFQHAVHQIPPCNITARLETDDKELRRKLKSLNKMHVSTSMDINDPEQADYLRKSQTMFMCNDHSSLPKSGLYDTLKSNIEAVEYITNSLKPDQLAVLKDLMHTGMINKSAFIAGIAGSGTSHLQRTAGLPFVKGKVNTTNLRNVRRNIDIRNMHLAKAGDEEPGFEENVPNEFVKPEPAQASETQPMFKQPADIDYEIDGIISEKGRSLYVAATNDTADALYRAVHRDAIKFATEMGLGDPLIYRRHAKSTEISAVMAMLHEDFYDSHGAPHMFDSGIQV
jgi:hypothetical protein